MNKILSLMLEIQTRMLHSRPNSTIILGTVFNQYLSLLTQFHLICVAFDFLKVVHSKISLSLFFC